MRWPATSDNVSYQPWLPRLVPPVPALQLTPRQGDAPSLAGSSGGDRRAGPMVNLPPTGQPVNAPPPGFRAYGSHERRGEIVRDSETGRFMGWLYSGVLESLKRMLRLNGFRLEARDGQDG